MPQQKNFKNAILDYIFILSKQPVLLKDLLESNQQFNEGMHVESGKLGFRLRLARAYLVYIVLVSFILVPVSIGMHNLLAKLNSHISILGAMIITALIFMGFNFFQAKVRDIITLRQIKKSWQLRFPYFPYEEYRYKVDEIYQQAMRKEVSKKDLERYILDNLVEE